jgi:hypothetical protein
MNILITAMRELWGLFVDDGSLALALLVWCALAGLGLPQLMLPAEWNAPILFVGCIVILVANVTVGTRARKLP